MKKIIALSILLLCVSFCFAEDINLSLEKLYEQQDTITTTQEIKSQDIEEINSTVGWKMALNLRA